VRAPVLAGAGTRREDPPAEAAALRVNFDRDGRVAVPVEDFAGTEVRNGGVLFCHRTPAVEGSTSDLQPRQCCLEFFYPSVRDLGADDFQRLQVLEFLQYPQSRVRDLGVADVQRL